MPDRSDVSTRSSLRVLRSLAPYLLAYRWRVAAAAVALLVAAVSALVMPLAFRALIDLGFSANDIVHDTYVGRYFIGLFGVALVLALGTAVRFYFVSWLGERVTADLRIDVYRHVLAQDPTFFETLKSGEVLSRLTTDTTLIQTLIGTSISMGLRNALLFAGSLLMMAVTSLKLASIIGGFIVLVMIPLLVFGRHVRALSRASQDRIADTSALAGERLGAIQTVQAFAREAFEGARFARATEDAFDAAVRRSKARAWLTAVAIVLVFGAIVFVLWLGANAVLAGTMSPGTLTQFILYAAMVAGATGALSEVAGDIQRAAGATERLLELLEVQPRIVRTRLAAVPTERPAVTPLSAARAIQPPASGARASVAFRGVTFSYPSRPREHALEGIDLQIRAGERVALVGPSGAGKTTLFHLLLRFYDPQQGTILLDGADLRELDPGALRERVGIVAQDSVVFSASALDNIRYGRLDATPEEVIAVARAAQAHEFIERLPDGYDTYLGERGVRLSGGQRQRIAIARALLKNPPLLLLDEATSALDAESERLVQAALEAAMQDRTTLVIAHRLATIAGADRIVVLDRGRIVEQGTHRELSEHGGLYARLAAMQFGIEPDSAAA